MYHLLMKQAPENHVEELLEVNQKLSLENEYLKERVQLLLAQLYGKKSEKMPLHSADQLSFLESELERLLGHEQGKEASIKVAAHQCKSSGRKALPEELERIEVLHDLPEEEKKCHCGSELTRIGEETSEQLDYIPAKLQVLRHVRPKYACKACEGLDGKGSTVKIAPPPAQMLPKSMASAGLLAQIITAKFVDALPFYRQEQQFKRLGYEISRSNMAQWTIQLGEKLERLLYILHQELKLAPLLHIDETSLQVLKEPGRSPSSKSYMWVLRTGASSKVQGVYFHYSPSRSGQVAQSLLDGFQGLVLSDGYGGYDFIDPERHAGCWAHSRRKFVEAAKIKGKNQGFAALVVEQIGKLYQIERDSKELSPKDLLNQRQEQSLPLLNSLHQLLLDKEPKVPPKSLLGKAIAYSLRHWDGLSLFLEKPDLPLDNNLAENSIRPYVVGRKNWLFSNSQAGARASAALYSLIETAKANGLNPNIYLKTLFERFPKVEGDNQIKELLPCYINLDMKE